MYISGGTVNASQLNVTDNSAGVGGGVFMVKVQDAVVACVVQFRHVQSAVRMQSS
jgi:hypothetical protein